MNHKRKLEAVLQYLINEEHEEAEKLLHQVIVEKAKHIYESIIAEEEDDMDDDVDMGDDAKDDFVDDIEADDADAEDGEMAGDMEDEEGDIEGRVEDLEVAFAQLQAEFEDLLQDEEVEHGMDYNNDGDIGDMGDDAEVDFEEPVMDSFDPMMEATEFLKKVKEPGMKGEESGVQKTSPINRGKKPEMGGKATDFAGGAAEKGNLKSPAKKEAAPDNVDVDAKTAPKAEMKPKHDDKSAQSLFSKKPR